MGRQVLPMRQAQKKPPKGRKKGPEGAESAGTKKPPKGLIGGPVNGRRSGLIVVVFRGLVCFVP
jgi:hypothetical protein